MRQTNCEFYTSVRAERPLGCRLHMPHVRSNAYMQTFALLGSVCLAIDPRPGPQESIMQVL
jgi:hypothetical protein